ncbi:hypothetical protein GMJFJA_GMJFJA_13630, partial [Dysosmobacter welbionis]
MTGYPSSLLLVAFTPMRRVVRSADSCQSSRASRARSVRFMNNANRLPNTKSSGLLTRFCGR